MTSDADDTKRSFTAGALTVNNRSYPRTLYGFDAERTWQLDRKYNTLVTAIGVSDSTPSGYGVVFTVRVDGDTVKEFTMGPGDTAKKLSVDIRGAFRVTLAAHESYTRSDGYGAWIDPTVTK
ncbi:NPCBM/NEW2 domain-containing protein [Streptomyces brevispora]